MKNVIIGIGLTLMLCVSILILYTVYGHNTRQNEVEEALTVAVEQSLENMKIDKKYDVKDKDEFIADFTQNLLLLVESDSEVEINILSIDIDKGLFDVEVIMTYNQPNGTTGYASCRKTVILEEYRPKEPVYCFIKFLTEKENRSGNFEDYKTFAICEGSHVIFPQTTPEQEGHTFKGWSLTKPSAENSYSPDLVTNTNEEGEQMLVSNELTFYAVFD